MVFGVLELQHLANSKPLFKQPTEKVYSGVEFDVRCVGLSHASVQMHKN